MTFCWGKKTYFLSGSYYLVVCEILIRISPDLNHKASANQYPKSPLLLPTITCIFFPVMGLPMNAVLSVRKFKICTENDVTVPCSLHSWQGNSPVKNPATCSPHHFSEFMIFTFCYKYMNHTACRNGSYILSEFSMLFKPSCLVVLLMFCLTSHFRVLSSCISLRVGIMRQRQ